MAEESLIIDNKGSSSTIWTYIDEAFYYVPVHVALEFQKLGLFNEALDWFKKIFDFSRSANGTIFYPPLNHDAQHENISYSRSLDAWLENSP